MYYVSHVCVCICFMQAIECILHSCDVMDQLTIERSSKTTIDIFCGKKMFNLIKKKSWKYKSRMQCLHNWLEKVKRCTGWDRSTGHVGDVFTIIYIWEESCSRCITSLKLGSSTHSQYDLETLHCFSSSFLFSFEKSMNWIQFRVLSFPRIANRRR